MAKLGKVLTGLLELAGIATDEDLRRTIFGEYSNGEPRSLPDAINGEYISPADRHKIMYGKKAKKKKKHNKKKKHHKKKGKKIKHTRIDFQL